MNPYIETKMFTVFFNAANVYKNSFTRKLAITDTVTDKDICISL